MSVKVEVWGDYACFSRPEMKVERVSYDVMTPSAARGIIEAIYWHPGMRWIIDKIYVMEKIQFTNVRRNEVKSVLSGRNAKSVMEGSQKPIFISASDDIQQRAAMILQNVHYVIEAHFEMTDKAVPSDNEGKFSDIMRRRLEKGQCYHQPCFGTREFPVNFKKWEGGDIETAYPHEDIDLGFMLFDMDYSDSQNITPLFFRAQLQKGVLDLQDCEVYR
ncbi:type I-C CRISPR-associated protein Cas5c [Scatolibacter rhodanostii]|uniref:type I-C CRISPR-associated protein Cas5c n=1 Tax=Scatolibacter rhodanostii TaxID=2014781 RepID=UPI000C07E5AA|nr:type I-C CRISPR-associated protein Cas5c [Scatolibacter rhodanostii]